MQFLGRQLPAITVRTLLPAAPPEGVEMTTAEEVREASRQQDGTPREQIDRELYAKFQMEREIMASEPEPGERAASRDLDELIL